jgi:hypothetical protein
MAVKAAGFRGKSNFGVPTTESLVKTWEKDSAKILAQSVWSLTLFPSIDGMYNSTFLT